MLSKDDEIGRLMSKCLSCGKCTPYCPSSAEGGLDPHELMVSGEGDPMDCFQCGNCSRICRRSDPFKVIRLMLSGKPEAKVVDSRLDGGCDIAVMPGCTVRERIPRLLDSTLEALRGLGLEPGVLEGEVCCLRPAKYAAFTDMERRSIVMAELAPASGKRVVTPCPECAEELGPDVDGMLDILLENRDRIPSNPEQVTVTVYTGCALRDRKKDISGLISALGLKAAYISDGCCGRDRGSEVLMKERLRESDGSSYAVTFCPRCTINYSENVRTIHISELVSALFSGGIADAEPYACPYGKRSGFKDSTRW
ncbi:MAG: (Fe-S)-binding protein [Candidatus Methanomethylophilaceae archaeon]|nr:(Fe-S)-binding protein [Candidatus Methanomethylophilaceae archaeon]